MAIRNYSIYCDDSLKDQIIESYLSGMSAIACARKYLNQASARDFVKRLIIERGITPRNGSQANIIRFQNSTPEERKQITAAANIAKRGKTEPEEQRIKFAIAQSKKLTGHHIGIGENEFAEYLSGLNIQINIVIVLAPQEFQDP